MALTEQEIGHALSLPEMNGSASEDLREGQIDGRSYLISRKRLRVASMSLLVMEIADVTARKSSDLAIHRQAWDALQGIRSRLTAVQNALCLFVDYDCAGIDEESRSLLRDSRFELWTLSRISENLRDLLLTAHGSLSADLRIEPAGLAELVDDAVQSARLFRDYLAKAATISCAVDKGTQVLVDRFRAARVVESVVLNALVYSGDSVKIDIRAERRDENVELRIGDNGFGMPPAEMPRVFEYGFRGANASRTAYTGSGVSLYLARETMNAMNGRISFDSREGEGSLCVLTFAKGASS
jgi:signal transduction histidine kinase